MRPLFIRAAAAISPLGSDLETIWSRVLQGDSVHGKARLPGGRSFCAAETVPGSASDIAAYALLYGDGVRKLIRDLQIAEPIDAIFFASAVGNLAEIENRVYSAQDIALDMLDFAGVEAIFHDMGVSHAGTRFICVPTGCCAGLQAIGLAKSILSNSGLKTAIIMSIDYGLTPLAFEAFSKINATSSNRSDDDGSPSRPFCADRSGFLFADGGGAVLVSTKPDQQDSAPVKIAGYGCVSSAYHMTDIATDGHSIRRSIDLALKDAQIGGGMIDHVNLHASGTVQNDAAEYHALVDVMGHDLPLITAFKGNHGHALGGANLIEVALSWKMLRERSLPPTASGLPVDAYPAVPPRAAATALEARRILKTASGFSGIHAAIVMEA